MTSDDPTLDKDALQKDLQSVRERVDTLVAELRLVDTELDGFEEERKQYHLVEKACRSLTELDALGAGELFWASRTATSLLGSNGDGGEHLLLVRDRIEAFGKRIHEVDDRRQTILDELQMQEDAANYIADSVLEAERVEEQKKLEWEIERAVDTIPIRASVMPWARGLEDDRRFRKTLAISLLVSLVFSIVLPLIDIPLPARWEVLQEQDRLTQLIRDEMPTPPPPPVEIAVQPVEKEQSEPAEPDTPVVAEELVAEAVPEAVPAAIPAVIPAPQPSPEPKGILAFREKFSSLADSTAVDRLGSNARIRKADEAALGNVQRSMVTSGAAASSGGINLAELSRDTGGSGQGLGGVSVTQATSSIGTGTGSDRPLAGGGSALGRTDEEIQIVFDRHKAALYRMYNRELRKNPSLKGQMVLRLTIEPDGTVSFCELKSSDMKSPNLAKQLVTRVKRFDFGAKDGVAPVTIVYPIDFLPAA